MLSAIILTIALDTPGLTIRLTIPTTKAQVSTTESCSYGITKLNILQCAKCALIYFRERCYFFWHTHKRACYGLLNQRGLSKQELIRKKINI